MSNQIENGETKAAKVRTIVESKENFVWATPMEGLCDIFEIENLGKKIAAEMAERLVECQLLCYPSSLPSQQQKSVIVMLAHSRFAKNFETTS